MKHAIVVGSGIAGLIAALELSQKFAVTLVTKAQLADSNTRWAQGGIAAAMSADDSVAEHIADTLRAGAGLCNVEAVTVLCTEGPARIRDLIRLGVGFDQHEGQLARGLEAAHSRPRVLHAGGDATGLSIEMALVYAVRAADIEILEHTFAVDLIVATDTVTGLTILRQDGVRDELYADAVVLACGGAGQLYLHTTNPVVATGDGVAMALRAGAQIADTEFYQFHPTALAASSEAGTFLISEAVRGEGAVLLDQNGRRFMQAIDPAAELAPRDVVARGIARQMAAQGGAPVLLDTTKLGASFLAKRFPTIDAAVRARGLDWSTAPIPVTPAAHYWMGGVRTDVFGRTSLPGLYAVGEVACTGVHGANRLASNSLLESLVFAWRCAHLLLNDESASAPNSLDKVKSGFDGVGLDSGVTAVGFEGTGVQPVVSSGLMGTHKEWALAPELCLLPEPQQPSKNSTTVDRLALRTLMWDLAGIERSRSGLEAAATKLHHWHAQDNTVAALETANLLMLARVLVAAALTRRESRGAHFREDFPETSEAFQHSLIYTEHLSTAKEAAIA